MFLIFGIGLVSLEELLVVCPMSSCLLLSYFSCFPSRRGDQDYGQWKGRDPKHGAGK